MERIKIDLTPSCMKPVLRASQYDNGREWPCEVLKDGTPYKFVEGDVCEIHVRKGDGCGVTASVPVTVGQSSITITSTEQMCAVYGDNIGELVVTNGTKKIGSCNLILSVESDPMNGSKSSNSEIHDLQNQVNECVDEALSHKGASDIAFDNTDTGLEATNVQSAIEEVNTKTDAKADADSVYNKTYIDNAFTGVNNSLNNKMDKSNPTGTGSFSLNRKAGTTVGYMSVALGNNVESSSAYAFASGSNTKATEVSSHAEGSGTEASGIYSHAEGLRTVANHEAQHVFGEFNVPDDSETMSDQRGKYVEIVGNGTRSNNRSNARTLDWQGNETLAGDLTYNGNKSLTSEITRLDGRIDALPEPMVFKGTLGVGGTIQTLPTASASNEGYTYKVITAGTYAGTTAKVGDVFTSDGSTWVLIPSGDEDSDTWRAIKVNGVEKLGNGISSGAVDFRGSANIDVTFDNDGNKVEIATKNIYTQSEVNTLIANAVDSVLPTDTASGEIANFYTSLEKPLISVNVENTATKIYQFGTNLWNGEWEQGTFDQTTGEKTDSSSLKRNVTPVMVKPDTNYARIKTQEGSLLACRMFYYDANMTLISTGVDTSNIKVITTPNNCAYVNFAFQNNITALSINYPSDETAIKAYNPNSGEHDISDKDNLASLVGANNIWCDSGDVSVSFKCSVTDYVNAHSGGGNRSVNLAKSVEEEVKEEPKDEPETRQER